MSTPTPPPGVPSPEPPRASPAVARTSRSAGLQAVLSDPNLFHSLQDAPVANDAAAAAARLKFETNVRRYYFQLTVGCGDPTCTTKLCRSHPACQRLLPDAAAVLAVQLAARPRPLFCPRCPAEPDVAVPPSTNGFLDASVFSGSASTASSLPPSAPGSPAVVRGSARGTTRSSSSTTPARGRSPSPTPFLHSMLASSAFASIFQTPASAPPVPPVPAAAAKRVEGELVRSGSNERLRATSAASDIVLENKIDGGGGKPAGASGGGIHLLDLPGHLLSMTSRLTRSISQQIVTGPLSSLTGASTSAIVEPDDDAASVSNYSTPATRLRQSTGGLPASVSMTSLADATSAGGDDDDAPAAQPPGRVLKYLTKQIWVDTLARLSEPADGAVTEPREPGADLDDDAHEFLLASIRHVFSSPQALTHSFRFVGTTPPPHASRLDIASIRETFDLILAMHPAPAYTLAVTEALELLLARLAMDPAAAFDSKPKLAQILVLLANPLLDDRAHYESLFRPLLLLLTRLRPKAKAALVAWLSTYPPAEFRAVVKRVHAYLSAHYYPSPKPDDGVVAAVRCLGLLYSANEVGEPVVDYSEFYNPTLNAQLVFKDEYRTWRRILERGAAAAAAAGSGDPAGTMPAPGAPVAVVDEFSFFNYPFLFDPAAKARIMHIDAMVQMSQEYEDACVSQALVVHTQKMLLADAARSSQLEASLRHVTNPYLVLEVGRQNLVDDVMAQVAAKARDLKKPLKIKFNNEEGMDQGGVQKEFFQVLLAQLLDPVYGMFTYDDQTRYSWLNPAALENSRQFELVGIVLGLAVYNGVIVDVRFPRVFYKRLLGEQPTLDDVKDGWPDLGRGLQQLLDWPDSDGDVEDIFCRSFDVSVAAFGTVRTVELVPNGSAIPVTNANRAEYVNLYVDWVTKRSVDRAARALRRGFLQVCGGYALRMCRPEELELLMCGVEMDLDLSALEKAAQYDDGYHAGHPTIRDFWSIVHAMAPAQKKKVLEFVTASDRVPLKGLGSLTFVVQRNGPDSDRLPTALTCFGRLLLPEYANKEKLRVHFTTAIENAKGFGLV
ncbi:hypothetical protein H9P43_006739 [Blastocladiella emersonii ATCC 22665]|nr:hypothetical protein H9P43_006739 [Blastocladiella emersonii ATCC 22665]